MKNRWCSTNSSFILWISFIVEVVQEINLFLIIHGTTKCWTISLHIQIDTLQWETEELKIEQIIFEISQGHGRLSTRYWVNSECHEFSVDFWFFGKTSTELNGRDIAVMLSVLIQLSSKIFFWCLHERNIRQQFAQRIKSWKIRGVKCELLMISKTLGLVQKMVIFSLSRDKFDKLLNYLLNFDWRIVEVSYFYQLHDGEVMSHQVLLFWRFYRWRRPN